MTFGGYHHASLFVSFEILKQRLKISIARKKNEGVILVPQVHCVNRKINVNIPFVMSSIFLIGFVFNELDLLMLHGIPNNFEEVMKSPFTFIVGIYGTIKSNAIEIAVSFKILKEFFKIYTPAQCFLGKVNV